MVRIFVQMTMVAIATMAVLTSRVLATPSSDAAYPELHWQQFQSPEQAGFIPKRLAKVEKFYNKRQFAGLMVVKNGVVAIDWGDNNRRFPIHSIRKSLLSALYGIHSSKLNLQATLEQLHIDDNPSLTQQERSATLDHILASRSGIYLPAAAETANMAADRPQRSSHKPGEYWWYNNWDFNVAGTIYQQLTREDIFFAFSQYLAKPLQMQDYSERHGYYVKAASEHSAFQFRMSSRDLARLGLLYARQGQWGEKQIIPQQWVKHSTQALSQTNMGNKYPPGYGYMWWVEEDGSFSARGSGGHVLAIYPEQDLVIVVRTNSYLEQSVSARAVKKLLEGILSASQGTVETNPKLIPRDQPNDKRKPLPKQYKLTTQSITLNNGQAVTLSERRNRLFVNFGTGEHELTYLGDNQFVITDRQEPLSLELDENGEITKIRTPRLFYINAAYEAKQGNLEKAQDWVEQVIEMMPESAIAYTNLAKILIAREQTTLAEGKLEIALKLDPDNKQAKELEQKLLIQRWGIPAVVILLVIIISFVFWKKRTKHLKD